MHNHTRPHTHSLTHTSLSRDCLSTSPSTTHLHTHTHIHTHTFTYTHARTHAHTHTRTATTGREYPARGSLEAETGPNAIAFTTTRAHQGIADAAFEGLREGEGEVCG